jgi:predicted O-methyltransferase YrrM
LAYSSADLEGDIIEVGSWCGRSAVVLAMAAKLAHKGKVHCIDLFPEKNDWYQNDDGSYSFSVVVQGKSIDAYGEQTVWKEPFERDISPIYEVSSSILDIFIESVKRNNLEEFVSPFRGNFELFSAQADHSLKARMVFIDGDHGYEAVVRDITIAQRYIVPGGWLCFDDAFTSYAGINEAITERIIKSPLYTQCQQLTRKMFVARRT